MWEIMKVCCLFFHFLWFYTVNPDFQARGNLLVQSAAAMTTVCTAFTADVDSINVQGENKEHKNDWQTTPHICCVGVYMFYEYMCCFLIIFQLELRGRANYNITNHKIL